MNVWIGRRRGFRIHFLINVFSALSLSLWLSLCFLFLGIINLLPGVVTPVEVGQRLPSDSALQLFLTLQT